MTPGSVAAQRDLAAALTVFHNRRGDPFGLLLARVAEEPDFLFGHLFLGAGLTLSSERRFRALGHAHLQQAAALATSDHPREYAAAEATAAAALDIEPMDGWAVHVIAHVMEMQGRADEGIDWLTGCFDQWAASDPPVGFACHNAWHLALMHLDREDDSACLQVLDRWIAPGIAMPAGIGDFAYGLADVTALLARLTLFDVDVGSRFETNARGWLDKLNTEAGYYAFNDFHAALAFAGTGRAEALDELVVAARDDRSQRTLTRGGRNLRARRATRRPARSAPEAHRAIRARPAETAPVQRQAPALAAPQPPDSQGRSETAHRAARGDRMSVHPDRLIVAVR